MLKKLLKQELKRDYIEMLIVYGCILLGTLLTLVFSKINLYKLLSSAALLLVLGAIGIVSILINHIIKTFNKCIFSNQGYLTMSLPITTDQLIISKLLISVFWLISSYLVLFLSFSLVSLSNNNLFFLNIDILFNINLLLKYVLEGISLVIYCVLLILLLLLVLCLLNCGKIRNGKFILGLLMFIGIIIVYTSIKLLLPIIPYGIYYTEVDGYFVDKVYTIYSDNYNTILIQNYLIVDFGDLLLDIGAIISGYFLNKSLIKNHLELE